MTTAPLTAPQQILVQIDVVANVGTEAFMAALAENEPALCEFMRHNFCRLDEELREAITDSDKSRLLCQQIEAFAFVCLLIGGRSLLAVRPFPPA